MGDDGYASPIVGALGALIRDWIRSRNYVLGVSGWQIEADGDAEFNDVNIRGVFSTGDPPDPYVKIYDDGTLARIDISGGDPAETFPGTIYVDSAGGDFMLIHGPSLGGLGYAGIKLQPEVGAVRPSIDLFRGSGGVLAFLLNVFGDQTVSGRLDVGGILTADNLRRGVATTPAPGGVAPFISSVAVNFASTMPGTPTVVVTPTSAVGAITAWSATAITANGFTLNSNRTNNNATNFNYFAIGSF